MSSISWSNEKTVSFIDAVRLRPCIWNSSHPEYKIRQLKKDEWHAIAQEFDVTVDEAQKKFKNLRTYFRSEIKRIERRQQMGSGSGAMDSTWFGFKSMLFLTTVDEPDADNEGDIQLQFEKTEDSDDDTSTHSHHITFPLSPLPPPTAPDSRNKKRIKVEHQYDPFEMDEIRKKPSKSPYPFGDHVIEKLLSYNDFVRNQVEFKISSILYEADMGYYNKPVQLAGSSSQRQYSPASSFVNSPTPPQARCNSEHDYERKFH